jgi:hypothetical protein
LVEGSQLPGNFDDLSGRFAGPKNNLGKILAQGPVNIHLGKTEIGHRGGLKRREDLIARDFAGPKVIQQASRLGCYHRRTMPHQSAAVTLENFPVGIGQINRLVAK